MEGVGEDAGDFKARLAVELPRPEVTYDRVVIHEAEGHGFVHLRIDVRGRSRKTYSPW